jgi:mannose-1-phosphate guanylyltransferase
MLFMEKQQEKNLWSVILAGGNGERLQAFTRRFYDAARPKQYCAFVGTRTMAQHTYDRARMLSVSDKILTVVSGQHRTFVQDQFKNQREQSIIVQPYCRETAPAILLPVIKVNHYDPESIVTIFPSDHFILDEVRFMKHVRTAADFVRMNPDTIVLLGVRPDRNDGGFGMIEKGEKVHHDGVFRVQSFSEKPDIPCTDDNNVNNFFWNTFILIGRSNTLINEIRKSIPNVYQTLKQYKEAIGRSDEQREIRTAYNRLPSVNFSSSVLEKIAPSLCVIDISDVGWSDWGEEQRILEDVRRYDLRLNAHRMDRGKKSKLQKYSL